jgi:uncharacterized membrane protein
VGARYKIVSQLSPNRAVTPAMRRWSGGTRCSLDEVSQRRSPVSWFKPKDALDRAFEIGIILKGLDGLLELIGGVLLLAVSPAAANRFVAGLTRHELSEDPSDLVATHLLRLAHGLTGSTMRFAAAYLVVHGIAKVVLVVALLRDKLWAYPMMIAFLAVFIGYQLYRITLTPNAGLVALTVFDAFVAWLTWREYRKQRTRRSAIHA